MWCSRGGEDDAAAAAAAAASELGRESSSVKLGGRREDGTVEAVARNEEGGRARCEIGRASCRERVSR